MPVAVGHGTRRPCLFSTDVGSGRTRGPHGGLLGLGSRVFAGRRAENAGEVTMVSSGWEDGG